ncbi:MAG: heme-binding protein [Pseudomonadota bacterium]
MLIASCDQPQTALSIKRQSDAPQRVQATCLDELGQPQCIVIVDASGETLAQLRMDGAKFLSMKSARAKAQTAASIGQPSGNIPETVGLLIAAATDGDVTRLSGDLPIHVKGELAGGIGVGTGTPDQNIAVAEFALKALADQM